ncbi:LysR substrate-binding domain-containing protein [Undibacterium sp. Di27W]|uniref:LysR substrate-binding domain-containing protein n=1 Tax=Undibacterium sp. Di27W TaxID=3413036 RepID=UPI003BF0A223
MSKITFDLDVIRSFVTGIELGSFAKAADRLGRSTSAVSAQLKKLEEQVGSPILRKSGRGMVPTTAGETLLAYGRRLLELNDEAAAAVRGVDLEGWIRLGIPEDFGERILTDVLGRFARAHPRVRIEARIARNATLLELITAGQLDLALTWDGNISSPHSEHLRNFALHWIGAADTQLQASYTTDDPLPLIAFESPCLMRSYATSALDRANIPWRLSFNCPSLSGIWAAVAAGLGVTVRTAVGLPQHLRIIHSPTLPALPMLGLTLHRLDAEPDMAVQRLREIILETLMEEDVGLQLKAA